MMGGFGNFGWGYGMMGGFMWFGGFICIIVIVLIVLGVVRMSHGTAHDHERVYEVNSSRSAIDIIKSRYAKGEITKEQYEQYMKDLV